MKALPSGEEEEAEEEKNEDNDEECATITEMNVDSEECSPSMSPESSQAAEQRRQQPAAPSREPKEQSHKQRRDEEAAKAVEQVPQCSSNSKAAAPSSREPKGEGNREPAAQPGPRKNLKKKVIGPSGPPVQLSERYPEDDPDYCVWMPPAGQTGDGRTSLNDKYGY